MHGKEIFLIDDSAGTDSVAPITVIAPFNNYYLPAKFLFALRVTFLPVYVRELGCFDSGICSVKLIQDATHMKGSVV